MKSVAKVRAKKELNYKKSFKHLIKMFHETIFNYYVLFVNFADK